MKRRAFIAVITALLLALNAVSSFAAVWKQDPEDPNNPTGRCTYTCQDGTNFDRLSFSASSFDSVDFVFNGFAYDGSKTYTESEIFDNGGYAVADGKLYRLNYIGGWSPYVPDDDDYDYTGKTLGFEIEFVPTNEVPKKSMTTTEYHITAKDIITTKYLINGKEVSKTEYDKAKTGTYTEKMKKQFTGYGDDIVDKEEYTFDKLVKLSQVGPGAESAPWSATFSFIKDQYITSEMNYLKTYEIIKSESSSSSSTGTSSGSSSASSQNTAASTTSGAAKSSTSSGASKTATATVNSTVKTTKKVKTIKKGVKKVTAVVSINKATVRATDINKALKDNGLKKEQVTKIILGAKVNKIQKSAFKDYKNAKTLIVKTKKLKKASIKDSLKGSKITTVSVTPASQKKTYVKKYKKIFTKKIVGRKVKVS